jgi:hypothetical protein
VRIKDFKQEFCQSKSLKRSSNDHELLKPFVAKDPINYQQIMTRILDGSISL